MLGAGGTRSAGSNPPRDRVQAWQELVIDESDKPIDEATRLDYRWRLTRHLLPCFAGYRLDQIDRDLCLAFKARKLQEAHEVREALAAGADTATGEGDVRGGYRRRRSAR